MKRISELDALRGFALFGILLVNIFVFHAPLSHYGEFYGAFEGIQAKTIDAVVNFAGGKFLFIFAFLFGYGIVLQRHSRADHFNSYFIKRMLVLMLFGLLHIGLFWFGDILTSYALLGLLVLPMLKWSGRSILICAGFFIFFRPLYYLGVVLWQWPKVHMAQVAELKTFISTFGQGSYMEIFQLRMAEFMAFMPENLVWYIPKTFGLFLLGIYAARHDFFLQLRTHRNKYLLSSILLFASGIVWIYFKADLFSRFDLTAQPLWRPILIALNVLFETALGISYIIIFSLAFQKRNAISNALAKTGRLALSNYILQSLFCVLIFYGYGLGQYGLLRPSDLVFITILIFGINVGFSILYLHFKTTGPLEYLWRKGSGGEKLKTN